MKHLFRICSLFFFVSLMKNTNAQTGNWRLAGNTLAGTEVLGSKNNFDLKLITNNIERMRLTAGGKLGMGITTPAELLHLSGGILQVDNSAANFIKLNSLGSGNVIMQFLQSGALRTSLGFDNSTNDFVIATDDLGLRPDFIINRTNGFVGLNTKTPTKTLDVNGSGKIAGDLTVTGTGGLGDLFFTYYQQSIRFPTFGTTASNSAMIFMTETPTANARMVLAHSKSFSNWGLQYNDANDQFNFLGAGSNKMAINLSNGRVGIGNAAPSYIFDVSGTSRFMGNIGVQTAPNTRTIQCGLTQGALIGIGTAEYIQDAGSSTLSAAAHWVPTGDGFYSLGSAAFRWNTVWAMDGTINTSDAKDKSNIRDMNYGLKEIMKLRAVKFNWKNNEQEGDKLGVVAQEIQKVLPEVVRDWQYAVDETTGKKTKIPTERLGVMYADIIPVLIRGMQEQQKQIEELKQLVSQLAGTQQAGANTSQAIVLSTNTLEQNIPNPAKNNAVIRYNVTAANAQLKITDANGRLIRQVQLSNTGNGSVNIDCSTLSAGTYYYSLMADGKIIDSKKMVVAN